MEPPEDWHQEVQTIEAIVILEMEVLKIMQAGNSQLISNPDDDFVLAHLSLSVEGAMIQLLPPLSGNTCISLIRSFFNVCCLEYILP